MTKVRSAEMSWQEVESAVGRGAVAIFPMASTEEHGPHAPTGDYLATDEIAARAADRTGDVVVPCLPFGYSEYFRSYPGTISIRHETLLHLVLDVVECLIEQGFTRIVLLNGHQGNVPTLGHLIRQIRREHRLLVPVASTLGFGLTPELQRELYGDATIGHGGEPMGSVMMYLFPDLVDLNRGGEWGVREFHGLRPDGFGVSFEGCPVGLALNMEEMGPPSGSLSDPLLASSQRGRHIVEESVERLVRFVEWFKGIDPRI